MSQLSIVCSYITVCITCAGDAPTRVELNPRREFLLGRIVPERDSAREGTILIGSCTSAQLGSFPKRVALRERLKAEPQPTKRATKMQP
jgi:hypothetical protein